MINKQVESWFVREYPNGVICLTINTVEKWVYYHRYNDYEIVVGESEETEEILKLPEFLPKKESKGLWIVSDSQDKDQIHFYYMYFERDWIPNQLIKTIAES